MVTIAFLSLCSFGILFLIKHFCYPLCAGLFGSGRQSGYVNTAQWGILLFQGVKESRQKQHFGTDLGMSKARRAKGWRGKGFWERAPVCVRALGMFEELKARAPGAQRMRGAGGAKAPRLPPMQGMAEPRLAWEAARLCACSASRCGQDRTVGRAGEAGHGGQCVVTAIVQVSDDGGLDWRAHSKYGESRTEWRHLGLATDRTC